MKNTVKILTDLQAAFPVPKTPQQVAFFETYLQSSLDLTGAAIDAIQSGEIDILANCIRKAQDVFDKTAIPLCPSELTSPRLHAIMQDGQLSTLSLAAKGVGSQGDGSIQVLCSSEQQQAAAIDRLNALGCEPFALTIPPNL